MGKKEKHLREDCLVQVFWGVLDDSCKHFRNPLSSESAQTRYMDPESVCLPGTRLGHMDEKLACNETLMNVSVPRQWIGREAAEEVWFQSV